MVHLSIIGMEKVTIFLIFSLDLGSGSKMIQTNIQQVVKSSADVGTFSPSFQISFIVENPLNDKI
jgi:hypothetical protein